MGYTADYERDLAERLLKMNNICGKVLSADWHMNGACTVVWSCIEKKFIFKKEKRYARVFTKDEVDEACKGR